MLNRSLLQCITFAKSVYSYSRLTSHDTQQCGLFKATVWVQLKNGSGAQVTWALCQDCLGGNGSLCSPLLLRDKPLDALAGCASSVSIGGKKTAIGYITLPRLCPRCRERMLFSGWPLAPWTTHYDKCVTHYYAKNTLATEWGEAT